MRQALSAARQATEDESLQEQVLRETARLMQNLSLGSTPPEMAHQVHKIVRDVTKNSDPYKKVKEHDNKMALNMYPWLKKIVEVSDDRLFTALKLASAGNIIDYALNQTIDVEKTVLEVLEKEFALNDYSKFKKHLQSAESIAYLADNAGEIVFDRILIEELSRKSVTVFVKGGPIINDATIEDAESVGLDKIASLDLLGNGTPGTGPERNDPAFLARLQDYDMVVAKGQGNFEGLNNQRYIYFLLMAKCPLIARDIGVKKGDIVFCRGGMR